MYLPITGKWQVSRQDGRQFGSEEERCSMQLIAADITEYLQSAP
jgi:hypothetical protein